MEKILVSACILGRPVRYDGSAKLVAHPTIERWQREGRIVSICPELVAGFSVPRPPAEIAEGQSGGAVLAGRGRVIEASGADVTELYLAGAAAALDIARQHECRFALLADGSPSCGSGFVYDGTFAGHRHDAVGVTTAVLQQHGIEISPKLRSICWTPACLQQSDSAIYYLCEIGRRQEASRHPRQRGFS